jgi:hypothetical protein
MSLFSTSVTWILTISVAIHGHPYPQPFDLHDVSDFRLQAIAKLIVVGQHLNMLWVWDPSTRSDLTELMMAVQHLNISAIKTLLRAGENIHARNFMEQNMQMIAVAQFPAGVNYLPEDDELIYWND